MDLDACLQHVIFNDLQPYHFVQIVFSRRSEDIGSSNWNGEDAAVLVIGVPIVQQNPSVNDGLVRSEIVEVLVKINGERNLRHYLTCWKMYLTCLITEDVFGSLVNLLIIDC